MTRLEAMATALSESWDDLDREASRFPWPDALASRIYSYLHTNSYLGLPGEIATLASEVLDESL